MSEIGDTIDVSKGNFFGKEYKIIFEFYGHVVTERNESIFSKQTAYELGFTALAAVEMSVPEKEFKDKKYASEKDPDTKLTARVWTLDRTDIILQYMEAIQFHNVNLGHRVVTHMSVTIREGRLFVRLYISHTEETLRLINEMPVISVLHKDRFKTIQLPMKNANSASATEKLSC